MARYTGDSVFALFLVNTFLVCLAALTAYYYAINETTWSTWCGIATGFCYMLAIWIICGDS